MEEHDELREDHCRVKIHMVTMVFDDKVTENKPGYNLQTPLFFQK